MVKNDLPYNAKGNDKIYKYQTILNCIKFLEENGYEVNKKGDDE